MSKRDDDRLKGPCIKDMCTFFNNLAARPTARILDNPIAKHITGIFEGRRYIEVQPLFDLAKAVLKEKLAGYPFYNDVSKIRYDDNGIPQTAEALLFDSYTAQEVERIQGKAPWIVEEAGGVWDMKMMLVYCALKTEEGRGYDDFWTFKPPVFVLEKPEVEQKGPPLVRPPGAVC